MHVDVNGVLGMATAQKSSRTTMTRLQYVMQCVPSVTFRTTRSTRLFAQMMRRAGYHDFNWVFESFRELTRMARVNSEGSSYGPTNS